MADPAISDIDALDAISERERHRQQIAAFMFQGDPPPKPAGGWRDLVGGLPADPIQDAIFEAGRRIREAERSE